MSTLRKYFFIVLSLFFIVCLVGMLVTGGISADRLAASRRNLIRSGVSTAARTIGQELETMENISLSLAGSTAYRYSTFSHSKDREISLLKDFQHLSSRLNSSADYFLLYHAAPEWIFCSDGRKWTFPLYAASLRLGDRADELFEQLQRADQNQVFTDAGERILFAYPVRFTGLNRQKLRTLLTFAVRPSFFDDCVRDGLGNFDYEYTLWCGEQALFSGGQIEKNAELFSEPLAGGEYRLDVRVPSEYPLRLFGSVTPLETFFLFSLLLVVITLSLIIYVLSLKPYKRFLSLFSSAPSPHQDMVVQLESLIRKEMEIGAVVKQELKGRLLNQLLTEPMTQQLGELSGALGIRLSSDCFCCVLLDVPSESKSARMISLIEELSDAHFAFSGVLLQSDQIALLISSDDTVQIGEAIQQLESIIDAETVTMRVSDTVWESGMIHEAYLAMRQEHAALPDEETAAPEHSAPEPVPESKKGELDQKIVDYVDEHFCDSELSLTVLADLFGISAEYVSARISQKCGVPYKTYLTNLRMERAAQLLRETDCAIQDVSAQVGYVKVSNFIKKFKETTGSTPLVYQKSWRGR